jgi:hypothetical protein
MCTTHLSDRSLPSPGQRGLRVLKVLKVLEVLKVPRVLEVLEVRRVLAVPRVPEVLEARALLAPLVVVSAFRRTREVRLKPHTTYYEGSHVPRDD